MKGRHPDHRPKQADGGKSQVADRKQRTPWVPGSKDPARGSLVARGHGEPDGVPVNPMQTAVCKQTKNVDRQKPL
jgi:hypothetical protein